MKAGSVILISALTSIATVGACLIAKDYIEKKYEEKDVEESIEDNKSEIESSIITPDDFDLSNLEN